MAPSVTPGKSSPEAAVSVDCFFATECFRAERLTKGQKDGSESQVRVSHCIFGPIVAKASVESIARSLVIQWTIAARLQLSSSLLHL
jgi:hypothetical protein